MSESEGTTSSASSDPVPAIRESEATGRTAELFAHIRATLGVPVVNLVWRHIAVFPGALEWTWQVVRPAYVAGTVDAAADALREGLSLPELPGLPAAVLSAAGLSPDDVRGIRTVVDAYHRSNAMNLVALTALLARIDGVTGKAAPAPRPAAAVTARRVEERLPELLPLGDMAPGTAELVRALNLVGERGDGHIVASMYRHLANWPNFLALAWMLVTPAHRDGRLARSIDGGLALARQLAAGLTSGLGEPTVSISEETRADVRKAVTAFTEHPISKMVVMCAILHRALPPADRG
jgi:hypothetical protein